MKIKELLKWVVGTIHILKVEKFICDVFVDNECATCLSISRLFDYLNMLPKNLQLDFFVVEEYDSLEKRLQIKIYLK